MKPIPNFPDYFADLDSGEIYSMKLGSGSYRRIGDPPKHLRKIYHRKRAHVNLSKSSVRYEHFVAPLILEASGQPRPRGMYACHGVRGSMDDALDNVYWATPVRNNGSDKVRDGTLAKGEKVGTSKLTEMAVRIILRYVKMDVTRGAQAYLARIFGSKANLSRIVRRNSWKHVS